MIFLTKHEVKNYKKRKGTKKKRIHFVARHVVYDNDATFVAEVGAIKTLIKHTQKDNVHCSKFILIFWAQLENL